MATGLPSKIIAAIEKDIKKAAKASKTPWSGFGPIAEAHMAPTNDKAVVVWRASGTTEGVRTSMVVGIFVKIGEAWRQSKSIGGNYRSEVKGVIDVEQLVKKTMASWKEPAKELAAA